LRAAAPVTFPATFTKVRRIQQARETASHVQPLTAHVETLRRGTWLQLIRPGPFERTRATLPIPDLPAPLDGLRIIHLTDLHFRPTWFPDYDRLLDDVRADPPDLVLITGDFVEQRLLQRRAVENAARFCRGLTSRLGTFAITGNHDGDFLAARVGHWNLTLVENRRVTLEDADGRSIELIGLPGVHRLDLDESFISLMPTKLDKAVRIVLSHYPDHVRHIAPLAADLMLAGHTHGGQCCMPGSVPLIWHDDLPRRYASGVHRWDNTWLVVGRGLGFATLPWRTFCPTEVMEIVLKRET
jgi:predicted MPP superfamily phosphohydrolase